MKSVTELLNFSIINMDKSAGPTSFGIDEIVKRKLALSKTSHFGTLDPEVTGVLPIALGRACRLMPYFMHRNKSYVGIMRVHQEIEKEKLEKEMKNFIGKIKQTPPVKSRVKRQEREREVFSFEILEQDGKDFLFETEVEAGTYIRKLISDLGEKIGGAHMLELRRTRAGIFSEENIVNLYEFDKAVDEWKNKNDETGLRKILIPAEEAIKKVLPVVQVEEKLVRSLLTGKPIMKQDAKLKDEKFAVFSGDKFIGIYKKVDEGDIIARSEFILN